MSGSRVQAVGELSAEELEKFTKDVSAITISQTAIISSTPLAGKDVLLVTISVDEKIDGYFLRVSLKDGLLHHWGWDKKLKI